MDPFIGTILAFGFNFTPSGWAFCNGQQLSITQNQALYALIGVMYGGDGRTVFNLPDLRGRAMIGMGQGPGLSNYVQSFDGRGGIENSTTLIAHTHTATLSNASATVKAGNTPGAVAIPSDRNVVLAGTSSGNLYNSAVPSVTLNVGGGTVTGTVAVGSAGTGSSFSIMQPYLPMNFCIATQGIFPTRD